MGYMLYVPSLPVATGASRFSLDGELPPTEVTIKLIERIENVLLEAVGGRVVGREGEIPRHRYAITIDDRYGRETIATIRNYRPLSFPDSVSNLSIDYHSGFNCSPEISVQIAFGAMKSQSGLKVTVDGVNARDTAIGIDHELRQIISTQRAYHAFLYDKYLGLPPGILLMATSGTVAFAAAALQQTPILIGAALSLLVGMLYSFVIEFHNQYSVFESTKAKARADKLKWAVQGFLTFLVFGTLFTLVRREWLGF